MRVENNLFQLNPNFSLQTGKLSTIIFHQFSYSESSQEVRLSPTLCYIPYAVGEWYRTQQQNIQRCVLSVDYVKKGVSSLNVTVCLSSRCNWPAILGLDLSPCQGPPTPLQYTYNFAVYVPTIQYRPQ